MSVKKVASKRRSVESEVKSSDHAQPAGERRLAEAELRTLIARFAPVHLRLIEGMRRSLRKRLPAAHEVVYEYRDCFVVSYSPSGRGFEGVLSIRGSAEGVKLYLNQGKALPDPAKLLQGSASQVRWIGVESLSTLARPAVVRLIDEAIARTPVPFARAGRGSVVIRPTTARKGKRLRRA